MASGDPNGALLDVPDDRRWTVRPPMGSLVDPAFLPMYPPGVTPNAGALVSDDFNLDGPWHFHDMHQLMCAFEGALEVEIATGRHLVPRQLAAWIPAGVPHRVSLRKVQSGSIFFPRGMIGGGQDRVRAVLISPLMREMAREAMRWPLAAPVTAQREVFFAAMASLTLEWIEREVDLYVPTSGDPRLKRALDYVNEFPNARLADVCHEVGMSERSLRRHLKQETGMSLEVYRQRSRLTRAVALLSDTQDPVIEIAARCGFENPSSFARAFGAIMHETPSAYRARLRQGSTPD